MPNKDIFYCYSKRLNQFLFIFGIKCLDKEINPSNNSEYCTYEKTEALNFLLKEWDYIKSKMNFGEMIKE